MARLKITQTKSGIGYKKNQKETLRSLGASVRRLDVPPEARSAHDLFSLAVEQAGRAVDLGFSGNRLDQARQAVSQFSAAKSQLEHAL